MKKTLFILSGLSLLAAGCSVFPKPNAPAINYYSIGTPAKQLVVGKTVRVQSVSSLSNHRSQMTFSTEPELVKIDQFNRWVSSPSILVQRYLMIALAPTETGSAEPLLNLSGKLLTFENNLTAGTTTIGLLVTVRQGKTVKSEKLYSATVKVSDKTASGFAKSMSQAMAKVTAELAAEINKIR
jgi:ABC-type uncharacterized transport system auxiliary subunit